MLTLDGSVDTDGTDGSDGSDSDSDSDTCVDTLVIVMSRMPRMTLMVHMVVSILKTAMIVMVARKRMRAAKNKKIGRGGGGGAREQVTRLPGLLDVCLPGSPLVTASQAATIRRTTVRLFKCLTVTEQVAGMAVMSSVPQSDSLRPREGG